MTLKFDHSKNIILIDSSYYVFYRYFATMRWFMFQNKVFDIPTITENEEYISYFTKHTQSDITKICRKWKTVKENIVFCGDCQRCDIWRNDIYKDYKGNRITNENFNGDIFVVFEKILNDMSIQKQIFDRLEADDIVFLIQKELKKNPMNNIVIITNDNDYLQMVDKNIEIFNMQFKDISQRGLCDPKTDLYQKILFGDKSDNIIKISPNMTKQKSIEISKMDIEDIHDWATKENVLENFELNMKLISFDHIPAEIVKNFYKNNVIPIQ
jgi:5'-3' exonuclease